MQFNHQNFRKLQAENEDLMRTITLLTAKILTQDVPNDSGTKTVQQVQGTEGKKSVSSGKSKA